MCLRIHVQDNHSNGTLSSSSDGAGGLGEQERYTAKFYTEKQLHLFECVNVTAVAAAPVIANLTPTLSNSQQQQQQLFRPHFAQQC